MVNELVFSKHSVETFFDLHFYHVVWNSLLSLTTVLIFNGCKTNAYIHAKRHANHGIQRSCHVSLSVCELNDWATRSRKNENRDISVKIWCQLNGISSLSGQISRARIFILSEVSRFFVAFCLVIIDVSTSKWIDEHQRSPLLSVSVCQAS